MEDSWWENNVVVVVVVVAKTKIVKELWIKDSLGNQYSSSMSIFFIFKSG